MRVSERVTGADAGWVPVGRGVGRAFGGALLFSLPILMTMEMWELGVTMSPARMLLLLVVMFALAVGLSHYIGFLSDAQVSWSDAALDACIAVLVGTSASAAILTILSVIEPVRSWQDALSIVTIEALPATLGASFARSQLGSDSGSGEQDPGYWQELFLMAAGAVVLAANIAPTEEVVLIAAMMSPAEVLVLAVLSLALMHGFVYEVGFKGGSAYTDGFWPAFRLFTVVGYVIALGVSAYLLWTFGRFDGTGLGAVLVATVVLGLPACLGAAAARLIL